MSGSDCPLAVDMHHRKMCLDYKQSVEEVAHVLPIYHAKDGGGGGAGDGGDLRLVWRFGDSPGVHFISVGTRLLTHTASRKGLKGD